MVHMNELSEHLRATFDQIEGICQFGDCYDAMDAIDLAHTAYQKACRHGCDLRMPTISTAHDSLHVVGRLLDWTDRPFVPPEVMTADEVIRYLRLDVDGRDPAERLRNLIRRQGLPDVRRGRLQVFVKAAVDRWLEERSRSNYAVGRSGGVRPTKLNRKERA